ncbi:MAG TPA: glycosyltransferase family 4 protein, partial [Dermatophilaceae bacterium]|nr:glycosyltransferase family 4 protein [Dermatophilaceae bacterium]
MGSPTRSSGDATAAATAAGSSAASSAAASVESEAAADSSAATASATLRVAIVGPTHPYKGGVATHTTVLAHELAAAGHDVTLVSWSHLYPSKLYPGEQAVPEGAPDVEPFPRTIRALSWARPDTWVRTGRRLSGMDVIIIVHVIPAVVPAHLTLLRAAGAGRTSAIRSGPRSVVIAHNVLPHEPHPGERQLMSTLLRRVDAVLVHSAAQAQLARELGADRVSVANLPPHLPGGAPVERRPYAGPPRLLAMGIVRDYKGVDVLLRALMQVPELRLTVAGEMWGEAGRQVHALAGDPRLAGRVAVHPGYVPADRLAPMLAAHDVMTLTYLSGSASQNALLAQHHGLPVLASNVGTFGEQVRHDIDGLLVPPGDERSLVEALRHLARPGVVERLRAEVKPPDLAGPWAGYVGALEALAVDSSADDRADAVA